MAGIRTEFLLTSPLSSTFPFLAIRLMAADDRPPQLQRGLRSGDVLSIFTPRLRRDELGKRGSMNRICSLATGSLSLRGL